MEDDFTQLIERIQALTGLTQRQAAIVAFEFEPNAVPSAVEIVEQAKKSGFDVEAKHERQSEDTMAEPISEVTFDAARVLAEVYENCPRVMCFEFPRLGQAPAKLEEFAPDLDLPDEVMAMLVKLNLEEGQLTVWVRDEANEIDRPIGPIDLRRFDSQHAMEEGIMTLLRRMPVVLRADWN